MHRNGVYNRNVLFPPLARTCTAGAFVDFSPRSSRRRCTNAHRWCPRIRYSMSNQTEKSIFLLVKVAGDGDGEEGTYGFRPSWLTANNKPTNCKYLQRVNVIFYAYVPFLRRYYIVHSGTTCSNIIITRVVKFIFFPMRTLSYSFILILVPGEKQIYNNRRIYHHLLLSYNTCVCSLIVSACRTTKIKQCRVNILCMVHD